MAKSEKAPSRSYLGWILILVLLLAFGFFYHKVYWNSMGMMSYSNSEGSYATAPMMETSDYDAVYYDKYGYGGSMMNLDYPSVGGDASVIKTSSLSLNVSDVRETVDEATALTESFEGFVDSSNLDRMDGYYTASLVLRVPSEDLDEFLLQLKEMSIYVIQESMTASDVTESVVDLQVRLDNLKAQETQYLSILDQAVTVDEVLQVTSYLSGVQYEIQSLQSQLDTYDTRVSYSTVYLSLTEQIKITTGLENWSPYRTVKEAFNSWIGFLQNGVDALIYLTLYVWPLLLVVLAVWIWKRRA